MKHDKIKVTIPRAHTYLAPLATIPQSPQRLYYRGALPIERTPSIAIVGTRRPTAYGKEVTWQFASELARKGVVVISGLALGVDSIAHTAALDAGGITLAVLPGSVDTVYPRSHVGLARQIIEAGGALISEYEPGSVASPMAYRFLERNRLVSGLADAVIVTEAAARSGTLATVAHALEQGRDVFVVPGNITSPLSAGCNNLIKQGAHPITEVRDVLEIIAPHLLEGQGSLALGDTPAEAAIIKLLQGGVRDGDALLQKSKLDAGEFARTLTMMEIAGTIRALGGNQWTLR